MPSLSPPPPTLWEYLGTVAGGDINYFHEQLDLYEKTKALIAQAKPKEVGR